jgi:O-antigen/teichoic acid export membrane protein
VTDEHTSSGRGFLYRRLARNSAYLAGATMASAALAMIAFALAARALSARDFGILILLQSAAMMLSTVMSFGTQQPIIRLGTSARAERDDERLGQLITRGLIVDGSASLMAVAAAFLLLGFAGDAAGLDGETRNSAFVFAGSLLFTGYSTSNGIFRLFDRFALLALIQTLCAASLLIVSTILFLLDASLEAFVWAWAVYAALNSQLQLWTSLRLVRGHGIRLHLARRLFSGADARLFLQYCWSTWAMSSAETLRANGDSLLVGAIVSVEAAGVYGVAKQLAGVLRKFNAVHSSALFPEISSQAAHGDVAGARQLKRRMMWTSVLIGAVAVFGALLVGELLLVLLFGPAFAAAYLTLAILTAAASAQLMSQTPSMYVQVYLGPKALVPLYLAAVLAFAAAAVPLTLTLSMAGTALAQLLFGAVLIMLCEFALRTTLTSADADARAKPEAP